MRRTIVLIVGLTACTRAATPPGTPPAPTPPPVARATSEVTADELRRDLFVFASDSFGGRETGTPDAERAARFLAARLEALGLEPAGDSGFFARVWMKRLAYRSDSRVAIVPPRTAPAGTPTRSLVLGRDILPYVLVPTQLRNGAQFTIEGDLVFGGYGMPMPALGRTDPGTVSLQGKAVVIVNGAPPSADSAQRARYEGMEALGQRITLLGQAGVRTVIVMLPAGGAVAYSDIEAQTMRGIELSPDSGMTIPAGPQPGPVVFFARAEAGSPLLPAGWPVVDTAQAMTGRLTAQIELQEQRFLGYNIVGRVRGTDPALNQTYVAFGAHYDHIGKQAPERGDSIANGADDDGSGSVALLAVARAMQAAPTRRSALFVWHVGEEKGLLGSEYFTSHPTVPLDSIVAQINADMIGRNAPGQLYVIGPGAAPNGQSRVLGRMLDSVNARSARPFAIDRSYDSPTDPERLYERSDHYNYAKYGIPIVFLTSGLHADYHRVTDEASKIDFDKLARVGDLVLQLGRAVGNSATRPK